MGIRSDRRYRFDTGRAMVWSALTRVDDYRSWWPWLRMFDGRAFAEGERWRCVVKPPLPYSLEFDIDLTAVVDGESARAELDGDINGWAQLTVVEEHAGCELRLVSDLTAPGGVPGLVSRFVPPLASFGHDWVLDNGIRQFRAAAFAKR